MKHQLTEGSYVFRPKPRTNPYHALLLISLILGVTWLMVLMGRGQVKSPLMPTPTPTRMAISYIQEAEAYFAAGKLDDPNTDQDAIDTYIQATKIDPNNALVYGELARIQTYSSQLLTTDTDKRTRLQEALKNIQEAARLAPDDSTVHAYYAFVLDWNASNPLISLKENQDYLTEAENQAVRALQLDPNNALAQAFYAEVLVDQFKWDQALTYAKQAVDQAPDLMDTHRVYATVLESLGYYNSAIDEYKKAADITPNLTFLYLRIGLGYRNLGNRIQNPDLAKPLYEQGLIYFERAARINDQLGIKDPMPYIAIAKTYTQMGEFFIASRNAEKALVFDPTNADTYGQLGMVYVQSKNYESALPALKCVVEGCTANENLIAQQLVEQTLLTESAAVSALPLTNLNVAYYYIRYGSVLAYMSQPGDGKCQKSLELMGTLRKAFPTDPILLQNIEDNEATCYKLMGTPTP